MRGRVLKFARTVKSLPPDAMDIVHVSDAPNLRTTPECTARIGPSSRTSLELIEERGWVGTPGDGQYWTDQAAHELRAEGELFPSEMQISERAMIILGELAMCAQRPVG